jgi:carboxymethylenebutenolidase
MTEKTGFAPAATPHASTAVHTPEEHYRRETSIPSQGENMPAYHARPKSADGPLPIVIVVQEIFGVHEHIRDLCRRLALEGYLAIAPELYFRQGDPNDYSDIPTLFSNLVSKVPDAQVLADLDHVASWAARNGGDPIVCWSPASAGADALAGCMPRITRSSKPLWPGTANWWVRKR